ncbi:hypothetical protein FSC37_09545 [Piscinibacter aquaticus]|uniref:Condensation domain-containing protein n=1 Tax=Piscinibacter aquaticus TaxID=392597 RepID=A0A5C6U2A2_9BURK|nr:hypothetical protein FSC37_09545 [Piscinibacter aquaticus]
MRWTLVRRHEPLRTRFESCDGELRQIVREDDAPGLALIAPEDPRLDDAAALALLRAAAMRPFDLGSGPLCRFVLLSADPDRHWLSITLHHIVADGWAADLLARELAAFYDALRAGRQPSAAPLPIQYADYAAWQRRQVASGALEASLAYWRARLAGAPPALELPLDRPRPALQRFEGALSSRTLAPALRERLGVLGRAEGATLFMVLLAAFKSVLARRAGQDDLCVGLPMAGRDREELQGLAGVFINTVVLRTRLTPGLDFAGLLRQCAVASTRPTRTRTCRSTPWWPSWERGEIQAVRRCSRSWSTCRTSAPTSRSASTAWRRRPSTRQTSAPFRASSISRSTCATIRPASRSRSSTTRRCSMPTGSTICSGSTFRCWRPSRRSHAVR